MDRRSALSESSCRCKRSGQGWGRGGGDGEGTGLLRSRSVRIIKTQRGWLWLASLASGFYFLLICIMERNETNTGFVFFQMSSFHRVRLSAEVMIDFSRGPRGRRISWCTTWTGGLSTCSTRWRSCHRRHKPPPLDTGNRKNEIDWFQARF